MIDEIANTHIGDSAKGVFFKGTQAFFAAQNAQEGHDDKKEEINDDPQHGSNDHDDVLSFQFVVVLSHHLFILFEVKLKNFKRGEQNEVSDQAIEDETPNGQQKVKSDIFTLSVNVKQHNASPFADQSDVTVRCNHFHEPPLPRRHGRKMSDVDQPFEEESANEQKDSLDKKAWDDVHSDVKSGV